jgi:predicted O-linked N-acetylglucosamine transferase (SPINDLY family)
MSGTLAEAQARLRAGDAQGARAIVDALLARGDVGTDDRIEALKLRSRIREALRDLRGAIVDLEGAAALAPTDASVHNDLGILYADAGEPSRAISSFRRAVTIDPAYARAWNNVGNAERALRNTPAAEAAFARATAVDPRYALAWANLGATRRELGDDAGAEAALTRALELDGRNKVALVALAALRRARGALDSAVQLYSAAVQADPRDANLFVQLGGTLAERDDLAQARQAYDAALARDPGVLRAVLGRRLTLAMVPADADAVVSARERYAQGLDALHEELPRHAASLGEARILDELRWTNFLLAYQGEDDRLLQTRYGDLIATVLDDRVKRYREPIARRTIAHRVRVGFASAFLRDGTVGRYFERWITDLPRDRFDVRVYHLSSASDTLTERLAAGADAFTAFPRWRTLDIAARIRGDALDVLAYPELGMDATTFVLGALRLAPVQCAGWGHPVTTGLATIDAFISVAAMEPAAAQAHYREPLALLPGLGTRYAKPEASTSASREDFGLPADGPLLLCPQSLFKIHPSNDALFARVLAAAPRAGLVLFEGRHRALTAVYLARLDRALAAHGVSRAGRVHVLPQCSHADYLRLNTLCDAMLDTLRWSGGNTSLDAIACGLPIVTLPGAMMRGRQSAAMLALAGVGDTVAKDEDDYVRIAVRVARERTWRDDVAARVVAGQARLFDDARSIDALADGLERLADGAPFTDAASSTPG